MGREAMTRDAWTRLRALTSARIALGRAGGSLPTAEVLKFSLDHAAARDAVAAELDVEALRRDLELLGERVIAVASQAEDRRIYLQRPDLGRRLAADSCQHLATAMQSSDAPSNCDLAIIISDGLSAPAAQRQAAPLLRELLSRLAASHVTHGALVLARLGRVAIQDEIGAVLKTRAALILLGERPGLGSPDSLGAYLVFDPKPGNTDANRNCVSNIRPEGLPHAAAADVLHHLITQSLQKRLSGISLKDERQLKLPKP